LAAEIALGARARPIAGVTLELGVGTGLWPWHNGYAAADVRFLGAIRYASAREPCLNGPEDYDGHEDGDLWAEPDNDRDGVLDVADICPNDAEDFDGFGDDDGCPDTDDDADGVSDRDDACPRQTEDLDLFQDDDGCPEPDNDEDTLADVDDECSMDPEDRDGYEDTDGCPEPGPERAALTVTDTRILVSERIYFDWNTDTIRPISQPLLDQLAEVILALPPDRNVLVDGHTDNTGAEEYNTDLSFRRARSVVEYLTLRGVPEGRLRYKGSGSSDSVAPNDSQEGQALNRRVEFFIE
jgi:outer membrane protein OmpA-like peptidoglycan-associated protein